MINLSIADLNLSRPALKVGNFAALPAMLT